MGRHESQETFKRGSLSKILRTLSRRKEKLLALRSDNVSLQRDVLVLKREMIELREHLMFLSSGQKRLALDRKLMRFAPLQPQALTQRVITEEKREQTKLETPRGGSISSRDGKDLREDESAPAGDAESCSTTIVSVKKEVLY